MRAFWTIAVLCAATLMSGCIAISIGNRPSSPPPSRPRPVFEERMKAALAMTTLNARDEALRSIALDASQSGDAEASRKAVTAMMQLDVRNRTASECALKLAGAGNLEEARGMAELILDLQLRDETLGKIAAGKDAPTGNAPPRTQ
jgi:hypothetical protein